jgi:hypothetical protein
VFALGCGGSVADLGDGGAAEASADASTPPRDAAAETCPPGTPVIPVAAIYACDAGAPPDAGCSAANVDPNRRNNPNIYPLGCEVTLPQVESFCVGACCGPLTCTCQNSPLPGGAQFLCPL